MKKKVIKEKSVKTNKKQRHHLKHHPLLTFFRVVKNGAINLLRNAWLSVAATAIMTVTLTAILLSLLANKALNETIENSSQNLTLSVYLLDEAGIERQRELRESINSQEIVTNIEHITKDEALAKFKEDYKDDPGFVEAFTIVPDSVLPGSFKVSVNDLERINEVVSFVEGAQFEDIVESTSNDNVTAKAAVENYTAQQRLLVLVGITVAVIFAFISIMVIFNTIRLAIYSRADEVRNMKLLGASHGYIRGPFLFEASMYGVMSGLLSFGFLVVILKGLIPKSTTSSFAGEGLSNALLTYTIPFFDKEWPYILLATILGGIVIGFVSSALALSRYMRY